MAWLDGLLLALAERLISRAYQRGKIAVQKQQETIEREIERKELNEKNIKTYNDAKSRQTRIEAALRVLNRR